MLSKIIAGILCLLAVSSLSGLEIQRGKLKLTITDRNGRFALSGSEDTAKGAWTPLFLASDPTTSKWKLQLGDRTYVLGDDSNFSTAVESTETGAKVTWKSKTVVVTLAFDFIVSISSAIVDGLRLEMSVVNVSDTPVKAGLRWVLDTSLGEKKDHFRLSSGEVLNSETKLESAYPDYWSSRSPSDEKFGLLVMLGKGSTPPSRVIFANWKRLDDATWDYSYRQGRDFNLLPYSFNDSAVAQYYDTQELAPASTRTVIVLLGLQSAQTFLGAHIGSANPLEDLLKKNQDPALGVIDQDISNLQTLVGQIDDKLSDPSRVTSEDLQLLQAVLDQIDARKKVLEASKPPDMAQDSPIRQAWQLYKDGRFAAALELLEPKILQNREDPVFFRVLGLCCLRLGDWKGGETYLERSRQLEENPHRDTLLGLIAVSTRGKDYGNAAKVALELLDRDPKDKLATKALAKLRAALITPEGGPGIDKETLASWLPKFRRPNKALRRWLKGILITVAVAACALLGTWWGISMIWTSSAQIETRKGPTDLRIPQGASDLTIAGSDFALTLTPEEIKAGWDKAQKAFQGYHDSRARYEINRLLLSNASAAVKERARGLLPYLHEPDFARADDSSTYQEVRVAPALYEGCTVKWSGVLSNLIAGDKLITFDLLLGYQNGQVVEGIVPVQMAFAALLKNSEVVEVLGRVALRDGGWYVQATSLREVGYRAP